MRRSRFAWLLSVLFAPLAAASDLAGLWESQRVWGPETGGTLLIREVEDGPMAEVGGVRVPVTVEDAEIAFTVPDGSRFQGRREPDGRIAGHWVQPPSRFDGNVFATPVSLERSGDTWRGRLEPEPDTGTFYLLVSQEETALGATLINPERNLGIFTDLSRLERDGDRVSLWGKFRGRGKERVLLSGQFFSHLGQLIIDISNRGGLYPFRKVAPEESRGFLARRGDDVLLLAATPELNDGWRTASLVEVNMDPAPIRRMIERVILPAPTSTHDLSIHALLIARHGKLVVEEYFHGYHRERRHDSRSASKSVTAILAAAAMQAGMDLDWGTPVYATLGKDGMLEREPGRGAITLKHLVHMSSGLDCDDRNPESAAHEDNLWDRADELDFYEHTLETGQVHPPGEVTAYCSAGANLAGGVVEAAAGEPLLRLLRRLLAAPLDIAHYAVVVPPDGHPYMGGGIRWLPRDFLKFPQLLLDGGEWNGRRVISAENARRFTTPEVKMDDRDYGYLWWTAEYPYRDRTVKAHFMGGNGGQVAMLVPELELAIAFNAGNYSDRVMFRIQEELIPEFILPAVRE